MKRSILLGSLIFGTGFGLAELFTAVLTASPAVAAFYGLIIFIAGLGAGFFVSLFVTTR